MEGNEYAACRNQMLFRQDRRRDVQKKFIYIKNPDTHMIKSIRLGKRLLQEADKDG